MFTTYWQIFWRTFAQLELAVVLAAQTMDWSSSSGTFTENANKLGALTLMALIGGLVAVLWAFVNTPATSALQKAIRSAVQGAIGLLSGIVINEIGDITKMEAILIPGLIAIVLAFAVTFFQYQPAPAPSDAPPKA